MTLSSWRAIYRPWASTIFSSCSRSWKVRPLINRIKRPLPLRIMIRYCAQRDIKWAARLALLTKKDTHVMVVEKTSPACLGRIRQRHLGDVIYVTMIFACNALSKIKKACIRSKVKNVKLMNTMTLDIGKDTICWHMSPTNQSILAQFIQKTWIHTLQTISRPN